MRGGTLLAVMVAVGLVVAGASVVDAYPRPGETAVVNAAADGGPADGDVAPGILPSVSHDGRYVAFASAATNLVAGQEQPRMHVYVRDRHTGVTERVSVASDGTEADRAAAWPSISGDGRYVAFASDATTLAPGITNGLIDVFVHDRVTRETVRVSVSADGGQADSRAQRPAISADGRHVAFASAASNLVPADTNGDTGALLWEGVYEPGLGWDVFVRDRLAGTTERVSLTSDGREGDRDSALLGAGAISVDGRFVALSSPSSVFAEGTGDNFANVYVHDRSTGVTERISKPVTAEVNDASALYAVLSGDGTHVAFVSRATTLTAEDTGGMNTLFLHHRGPGVGVGRLSAVVEDDTVAAGGWARFSGVTVAAADADESLPGLGVVNADLAGADVVFRPEQEDLLVRLRLTAVQEWRDPRAGVGAAGPPGTAHGFAFSTGDGAWEVRVVRRVPWTSPGAVRPPQGWPQTDVGLFRCDPSCLHVDDLHGGWGTAGKEVRFAIPLDLVGLAAGDTISGLRAYTDAGDTASGGLASLDALDLPDAQLPEPTVRLGVAPAGTPWEDVELPVGAEPVDGWFSATLPAPSEQPQDVWALACLGEACRARVVSAGTAP